MDTTVEKFVSKKVSKSTTVKIIQNATTKSKYRLVCAWVENNFEINSKGANMEKVKVLIVSILFAGVFSVSAHEKDSIGCERVYNADAKINCIKLDKVNRKLNRLFQLLEGSGSTDIVTRKLEYTCKGRVVGNNYFEGYGRNPQEAQNNFLSLCEKKYSKYTCSRVGVSCDFEEYDRRSHFLCEISVHNRVSFIKGVGRTKKEALSQSISLCNRSFSEKTCLRGTHNCYERQ